MPRYLRSFLLCLMMSACGHSCGRAPADIWLEYSSRWSARIVGWVYEDTSESYGLTVFESGRKRRDVIVTEGEVVQDEGEPVPEEAGLDWAQVTEGGLLETAKRLGAAYDHLAARREYVVFRLKATGP
jgi:hypothetical protein